MTQHGQQAFAEFCRMLYQDAFLAQPTIDQVALSCINPLDDEQKAALKTFLQTALARKTDAELKGMLNRHAPDFSFSGSSSRALLGAALSKLQNLN